MSSFRVLAASFLRFSLLVGLAGGFFGPAAPACAENLAIGTLGASFEVEGWQRVKLTDNIGPDQFSRKGEDSYLFVLELKRYLELRADYEAQLETFVANMRRRQSDLRLEPEMGFERYDHFVRATRRMFLSESGTSLFYQLDLISNGDGLAYVFVSWAPESEEARHRASLEELFDAFRLPGEGTDFYASSRPQPHLLEVGDWKIRLTFADSVLQETETEEPVRRTLVGDDENMALHLMLAESTGTADEVLDEVRAAVAEDESYEEIERGDLATQVGAGRWLRMRSSGESRREVALAVLPLEPGVWLDLRLVKMGQGFRQQLWESLVQSLEVVRPAKVDAFPEPAAAAAAPKYASPAAQALFEGSFDGGEAGWEDLVALPGGLLQRDRARLERLTWVDGKRSSELLYTFPKYESIELAAWGDQILISGAGQEVRRVVGGKLEPAGFRADHLAAAGESLLIARGPEQRDLPGLVGLPAVGATTLFLRAPNGAERKVAELSGREAPKLVARPGEALLAARFLDGENPGLAPDSAEIELLRLDLGKGVLTPLGRWFSVSHLAVAEGGWLVSGENVEGRQGVFLLRDGGGQELLVNGRAIGLALEAGSLVMRVAACPTHDDSACYLRSPLPLLAEQGPHFEPFTARQLNAIAAAARQQSGLRDASSEFPATRGASAAFFAAADALARQRTGSPLPTSPDAVDELMGRLSAAELSGDGLVLAAVLVAEALVREGAEWVAPLGRPGPLGSGLAVRNPGAIGVTPLALVASLGTEEGWYAPVGRLLGMAAGRRVLVGADPLALHEAAAAALPAELALLLRQGKTTQLRELLASRPGNLALRRHVYQQLAARRRDDVLAELSGGFAAVEGAASFDLGAAVASRLAAGPAPAAAEKLVSQLRDGIAREADEMQLYLLLGMAYEATARPDRAELAKACYARIVAEEYSPHGSAAQAALDRLEVQP